MKLSKLKFFTCSVLIIGISYIVYENLSLKDKISESDIKYLPYELTGQKISDFLLIFLHGFPNTMRMWDNMIKDLEKDFYCLNISYPNYSSDLQLKWGMDLNDISEYIKKTIDHVESQINSEKRSYKKIVISHDWGAFFAYMLTHKYDNYLTDMMTMDVGTGIESTISAKLFTVAYQGYLASNFLIGGQIGKYMTKLFVKMANPFGLTKEDIDRLDSSWNYPYYYLWRRIIYYSNILKNYEIKTPIAYIYGKNKPFHFHSEKFIDNLEKCEKCEVHAIDSDHWIMRKPENSKFLCDLIRKRMNYFV